MAANGGERGERLLWERGLTRAPDEHADSTQDRTERWEYGPGVEQSHFGGRGWIIAVDGSKVGRHLGTSRTSYAVTATAEDGSLLLSVSGMMQATLPCQNNSGRGELEVVLALLRNFGASYTWSAAMLEEEGGVECPSEHPFIQARTEVTAGLFRVYTDVGWRSLAKLHAANVIDLKLNGSTTS